jgi:Icc-related predicted phosphoesterase
MKIAHSSDIHGRIERIVEFLQGDDFDIWVDTGDFFPNRTRGNMLVEPGFQKTWAETTGIGKKITNALRGRPLICVSGNHDYTSLAEIVIASGGRAYDIAINPVHLMGHVFTGFREIPWIIGEWNGECHDFSDLIHRAWEHDPTILVTHCPPGGILDDRWGIPSLTSALQFMPHRIKHHFFGHIHVEGGRSVVRGEVCFHNSAERIRIIEV